MATSIALFTRDLRVHDQPARTAAAAAEPTVDYREAIAESRARRS